MVTGSIVISDENGRYNLWNLATDGTDAKQLTQFTDYSVLEASLSGDTVVFRKGADLFALDLTSGQIDLMIHNARVLNVYTLSWEDGQDIVIARQRIAWVGPAGQWKGHASSVFDAKGLPAVPGFGESHKHIESSMLSPELEAALVIPLGNTWTTEGSHEFANVSGVHNVEFWLTPERLGSPLKIFPALGSISIPSPRATSWQRSL